MTTIEHMEYNEEQEDFKRRERIRKRELEKEIQNNNYQNQNNQEISEITDDNQSTTNLLQSKQPQPPQPQQRTPTFTFQNYSEDLYANWRSALGDNPLLWLIPVNFPTGNGIRFKMEEATVARNAV